MKLLFEKDGFDAIDGLHNWADISCEQFFIIPRAFANFPVLKLLKKHGEFDIDDERNAVYLPIVPIQAAMLNKSCYADPPIPSYCDVAQRLLAYFEKLNDFARAQSGNKESFKRIAADIRMIQSQMRQGLENGMLHAAYPVEIPPEMQKYAHPKSTEFPGSGGASKN
ncbi:hypothetical protein [Methylobacterium sp. Leaf456]|uniref:hypothetical protein n=1 Tax=Methylobacterium sp. Leaf456 TaxID=1736382 RepID=UPI001AECAE81|nr:hypothetical protein [Methylobacterium sp. Leaf456]